MKYDGRVLANIKLNVKGVTKIQILVEGFSNCVYRKGGGTPLNTYGKSSRICLVVFPFFHNISNFIHFHKMIIWTLFIKIIKRQRIPRRNIYLLRKNLFFNNNNEMKINLLYISMMNYNLSPFVPSFIFDRPPFIFGRSQKKRKDSNFVSQQGIDGNSHILTYK